jgi:hypothetical protein
MSQPFPRPFEDAIASVGTDERCASQAEAHDDSLGTSGVLIAEPGFRFNREIIDILSAFAVSPPLNAPPSTTLRYCRHLSCIICFSMTDAQARRVQYAVG